MLRKINDDFDSLDEIGDNDYIEVTNNASKVTGIIFRCPGCKSIISVNENWDINLKTFTVNPSIMHKVCGWHGYIKNGKFVKV